MKLLLDTHVVLWALLEPRKLELRNALVDSDNPQPVSAACALEDGGPPPYPSQISASSSRSPGSHSPPSSPSAGSIRSITTGAAGLRCSGDLHRRG
jgi:hypothetical protein